MTKTVYHLLSLCLLWLLALVPLSAQTTATTHSVQGQVLDEEQKPLTGASVSLLLPDGKLKTGVTTSRDGSFHLRSVASGSYTLRITFVGYKAYSKALKVTGKNLQLGKIKLAEDGALLSKVKVIGKAAEVVVKGDTLEFNAGSYTTQQGDAVEELVKKLPGATINEQGQVTINGKTVSQIMVDGKRFFEGDPKVALKNLPAELVDKIQVVDRDSEAARLSGFSDGNEETILNLTIKAGKKRGTFGTAFAGLGTDKRYEGSAMLSRFTGDNQMTLLGSLNNTNSAGFSDVSSELASANMMLSMATSARGSRRGPGGGGNFGQNNGILTSRVLGGNISHTFSPKLTFGGNALIGRNSRDKQLESTVQNILGTGSTTERGGTKELSTNDSYAGNFRIEWKPDSLTQFIISPQLRYGRGESTYSSAYETRNDDATQQSISSTTQSQQSEQRETSGELHLDASRRLSQSGRTLTLSAEGSFDQTLGEGMYRSLLHSLARIESLDQRIATTKRSQSYRARLGWVEPLGKGFFTQLTYQLHGSHSESQREAFDTDATGQYTQRNAAYSNEFRSDYFTQQAGLALKKKGKTYDVTAGVTVEHARSSSYSLVAGTAAPTISRAVTNFAPQLRLSYKPQRTTELRLDYNGRSTQPTTEQLSPVQDVTNPLVVYRGNQDLSPSFQHNLFMRYNNFWTSTQTSLALFGHAQLVQDAIISRSVYDLSTGVRTVDYTNVNGNGMLGLGGFFTQTLPGKKFSLRLGSMNNLIRSKTFINGEANTSLALRLNENMTLSYRHSWVDLSLRGGWGYYNASNSLGSVSTPATKDYSLGWTSTFTLPLGFTIEGDATYTKTTGYSSGYDQEQTLLNAGISYSFLAGRKATIRLKGYDLLDSRRSIWRNITASSISTEETNTLGRYAMLHFIYRFDSFAGGGSKSDMKTNRQGPPGPPPF